MYDAERGRRAKKQRWETDGDSLRETYRSEREWRSDGKKHTRRRERKRFREDKSTNLTYF